jgi:hypothetical protein
MVFRCLGRCSGIRIVTILKFKKVYMSALLGGGSLFFIVFLFIMAVAWVLLPIALIGTKPLLKELIKQQKETNRLLSERLKIE